MHVHVNHANGEAKFWLEPEIALAQNYGLSQNALNEVETMVRLHEKEIRDGWHRHFPS